MASNLLLYSKAKDLVNVLELKDEAGVGMNYKDMAKAIDYINLIFSLVDRRSK